MLARLLLLLFLLAGLAIFTADWRSLRPAADDVSPAHIAEPRSWLPGSTYVLRGAARQAGRVWGTDPEAAIALIRQSTDYYPLDSRHWLDLARIEASRHGELSATLAAHLEAAVAVQPLNRATRWQAAQIALHAGDTRLAEHHLQQWLVGAPGDSTQALFIARRWLDDPDALIDRVLPDGDIYLARAMSFAFDQRDMPLAEAIWQRVNGHVDLDDPILLSYVDFLLARGYHDRAISIWASHDEFFQPGRVANGDFSRPLGDDSGLNWRIGRLPAGVRITRDEQDYYYRPASLRVDFSGDHNLRLRAPWIRIPVQPSTRYELSGYWRAETLTTRSLPFWFIEAEGARMRERVDVPGSRFDWAPWSVTFTVPDDVHMIRLRLRRDSTSAFDRYIDGQLWLDGIELTELPLIEPETDV